MTLRKIIQEFKDDPRFWQLLIIYNVLTPLWAICAYVTWHHDKITSVIMWVLFLYCGINALFKWTDV